MSGRRWINRAGCRITPSGFRVSGVPSPREALATRERRERNPRGEGTPPTRHKPEEEPAGTRQRAHGGGVVSRQARDLELAETAAAPWEPGPTRHRSFQSCPRHSCRGPHRRLTDRNVCATALLARRNFPVEPFPVIAKFINSATAFVFHSHFERRHG
jgi:hypothetical protein